MQSPLRRPPSPPRELSPPSKGKGTSSGGAAAAKKATKKAKKMKKMMKEELDEAIEYHNCFDPELLEDMKDVEFDDNELEELLSTFVSNDCPREEVLKFLVGKGLDIDYTECFNGDSPFGWAVDCAMFEAVEALLKAGVRVRVRLLWFNQQGDYARAEPLYRRAQEIFEKSLGLSHPHVATAISDRAGLLESQVR